jgi:hypothetical protein
LRRGDRVVAMPASHMPREPTMSSRWPSVLSASLIFVAAAPAMALIIDNFEEGQAIVADSGLNDLILVPVPMVVTTQAEQLGLSTANVIGGTRIVAAIATDPAADLPDAPIDLVNQTNLLPIVVPSVLAATATAALPLPLAGPPDDGMLFSALGGGAFRLIYDGVPGGNTGQGVGGDLDLDLSPFDSVEFTALGVTGAAAGTPPEIRLSLFDTVRVQSSPFTPVAEGSNLFALSAFPLLNLSNIQTILIDIRGISSTSSFQLTQVQAVPEPGTALLIAFGIAALAARARGLRSRG